MFSDAILKPLILGIILSLEFLLKESLLSNGSLPRDHAFLLLRYLLKSMASADTPALLRCRPPAFRLFSVMLLWGMKSHL